MSTKIFIPYELVRNNALRLAHRLYTEGYWPDIMYVCLRGGAYLGNVINEYFKLKRSGQPPILYAAVVARSYTQVGKAVGVCLDGWTYNPEQLKASDKVLIADDIFDSGHTLNFLVNELVRLGLRRENIKIAVHDYKIRTFLTEQLPIQPDYYCRKHIVNSPAEDHWLHYLSHELQGLTREEIERNYLSVDPGLTAVFDSGGPGASGSGGSN